MQIKIKFAFTLILCFAFLVSLEGFILPNTGAKAVIIKDPNQPQALIEVPNIEDESGIFKDLIRRKREDKKKEEPEKKTYTKVVLEAVRDGTAIFAATNGAITAVVPNPATGAAAAITGVIAAVTGVIASNIK